MTTAAEWGTGQVALTLLWLALFVIWAWLVVVVCLDVFRSAELSGWAKALWVLAVIVFPFLGIFAYLLVRGSAMAVETTNYGMPRARPRASGREVLSAETVEALAELARARDRGQISADEYVRGRARLLA